MQRGFTLFLCSALVGCIAAEGDESFIILNVQAPPAEACVFMPDRGAAFLSRGFADLNTPTYSIAPLFESRVVAAEGRESLRTIAIQGANISLQISEAFVIDRQTREETTLGAPSVFEHQQLFSSSLPPNNGIAIGIFDLIPFRAMNEIQALTRDVKDDEAFDVFVEVIATVTAFGDFYGDRLDTTSFQFPVTLSNTFRLDLGLCPLPQDLMLPDITNACSALQDTSVFCCQEGDGTLTCAPPTFAFCGNGLCETIGGGESSTTCPDDCGAP